jgi:hypothetical protein
MVNNFYFIYLLLYLVLIFKKQNHMKILYYLSLLLVFIGVSIPITLTSKFIMSIGGILFSISFYKIFITKWIKD